MKPALIDTNILSLFFRGHLQVVDKFEAYLKEYDTINLSIITYVVGKSLLACQELAARLMIAVVRCQDGLASSFITSQAKRRFCLRL